MTEFYCWAATNVGCVRRTNEDAFFASGMPVSLASDTWEGFLGTNGWALVADGMGGHAAGEIASRLAVECLRSVLRSNMPVAELIAAIEETNRALFSAMSQRPELSGMGTTIAGVLLEDSRATIFNAGDSRVYVANGHTLEQLSKDDVVHGYQLTKCLGGTSTALAVRPHITAIEFATESRLLLCTDGLTDELADHELLSLLKAANPASRLVSASLQAGGRDNVTVVVIEAR